MRSKVQSCKEQKLPLENAWMGNKYSAFSLSSNSKRLFIAEARLRTFVINHRDFLK